MAKEQYKGAVRLGKVDVDKLEDVSAQFNIESLPTILLFRQGKVYNYEGEFSEKEFLDFATTGYLKAEERHSISYVPSSHENRNNSDDLLRYICSSNCQRIIQDARIIFLLAVLVLAVCFYLLFGSVPKNEKQKSVSRRRKKK